MSDRPSEVTKTCTVCIGGLRCKAARVAESLTCAKHADFSRPDGRQCSAIIGPGHVRCGLPATTGTAGRPSCDGHQCKHRYTNGRRCHIKATDGALYCGSHGPKTEVNYAALYGTVELQQTDKAEQPAPSLEALIQAFIAEPRDRRLPAAADTLAWMLGRKDGTGLRRFAAGKAPYKDGKLPPDLTWLESTTHLRLGVLRRLVYHWMLRTGSPAAVRTRLDAIGIAADHHAAFIERNWACADRTEARVLEALLAAPVEAGTAHRRGRLAVPVAGAKAAGGEDKAAGGEIEDKVAGGEDDEDDSLLSSLDLTPSTPDTAPTVDAMDVTEEPRPRSLSPADYGTWLKPAPRPRALVPADYAAWLKPKVRDEVVAAAMEQLANTLKEELGRGNTLVVDNWAAGMAPTPHECQAILALIEGDELEVELTSSGFEMRYTPRAPPPVSRKRTAATPDAPPAKRPRLD